MKLPRRMRFRILLPIVALVLSIAMGKLGEAQLNGELLNMRGGLEPFPSDFAVATFVDYSDNAPAWVAALNLALSPPPAGTPWSTSRLFPVEKSDWWYRFFLVVMWFLIGYQLDRRPKANPATPLAAIRWRKRLFAVLAVLYGAFLCFMAVFGLARLETWFQVPVLAWGIGLIFAGVCPVSAARGRVWRVFFGTLFALVGVFECWAGVYIRIFTLPTTREMIRAWASSEITIIIWGAALATLGFYLLLRRPNVGPLRV